MGYGKQVRLRRIFGNDNRCVVFPVDHGVSLGNVPGLADPCDLLVKSIDWDIDAYLATAKVYTTVGADLCNRTFPARLLTCDAFIEDGTDGTHVMFETIDQALRLNVDAVKVLFMWGTSSQENTSVMSAVAKLVREAENWQIPIILEPLLRPSVTLDNAAKIRLISDAVRIAWELGADILKVGYPGDSELMSQWVSSMRIPVIMLGGPQGGTLQGLIREIDAALKVGVNGVAIGRKVWQRDPKDVPTVVSVIRDLVHGKIDLKLALEKTETLEAVHS